MTVDVESISISLAYTVTTTSYAYPFKLYDDEDLKVTYLETGSLTPMQWVRNIDYVVLKDADYQGGSIDTSLPFPAPSYPDGVITLYREMPIEQETDWVNNSPFDVEILERDLDKLIMICQQLYAYQQGAVALAGFKGVWDVATTYTLGDTVSYPTTTGSIYVANTDIAPSGDNPSINSDWDIFIDIAFVTSEADRAESEADDSATSATAAAASASSASTSATSASNSASAASTSEANAAASETAAGASETAAGASATNAAASKTASETARDFAQEWASNPEDDDVDDGVNPVGFSAYHWAQKAAETDAEAIHDNVAGEINAITAKGTPVSGDMLIIEDSEDSFNKKKVDIDDLPGGSGGVTEFDEADFSVFQTGAPALRLLFDLNNLTAETTITVPDANINLADIAANTAKTSNATHTGDVTGATALTIAANAVTNAKLANVATQTFKGRNTASTGDVEDMTASQARAIILNTTLPFLVDVNRAQDYVWMWDNSESAYVLVLANDLTARQPTRNVIDATYTVTEEDRGHLIRVDYSGTCTISFDLYANEPLQNNTMLWIQSATDNTVVIDKLDIGIDLIYNDTLYDLETSGKLETINCRIQDTDEIEFWGGLALK